MRGGCRPDLLLDGVAIRPSAGLTLDDYLSSNEVEAIEVYRGVETPLRFGSNSCGAIVVWTRVPETISDSRPFWKRFLVAAGGLLTIALLLNP